MKLFIIMFLLFSVSYGQSQYIESNESPSIDKESKGELTKLQDQLRQYVKSLMDVLLSKDTPRGNQLEVLDEIKSIAEVNGVITEALKQFFQKDVEYRGTETSEGGIRDENMSVWIKTKAELIRRKHFELIKLHKEKTEWDARFYIHLGLDGLAILAGGFLFFVPVVGPAVSIPLVAGRVATLTFTGRQLGTSIVGAGLADSGIDLWSYFFDEDEQGVLSFVSDQVFRNVLARELFKTLSSSHPLDRYFAFNAFQSIDEETLINDLLESLRNEKYLAKTRQSNLKILKAFEHNRGDEGDGIKEKIIDTLKDVIDKSEVLSLREASASMLGEMGEEELEISEYLQKRSAEEEESDAFRLIALIQSGRNKTTFPLAIESLAFWIKDGNQKIKLLDIELEIPDFFHKTLLSVKKEELSKEQLENYILILREFIWLRILDIEMKLRFSKVLIVLNGISDSKAFLAEVFSKTNLVKDLDLYVDNLHKEMLSEKNAKAFKFLRTVMNKLKEDKHSEIGLLITQFKEDHSTQMEIVEIVGKVEEFLESYKEILETIEK